MTRALYMLLCVALLQAQAQKSVDDLTRRYDDFRKRVPGVSLVLLLNQEKYAPGDTAWFKAYFLNNDSSPVKGRQLLDVALVSAGGEVLQHFMFSAKDGAGFNQLVFPADIKPGVYTIAAYSNWMKSFTPPPLFSKQITVVGEKEVLKDEPSGANDEYILDIRHNSKRGVMSVTFSAQETSTLRFRELHLVVTSNNSVVLAKTFLQALNDSVGFSYKAPPGIYYISLIDKLGRIVDSRNYRISPDPTEVSTALMVKIEKKPEVLYARGKAEVFVTVLDGKGQPMQGEFALKVLNGTANLPVVEDIDPWSGALMQQSEPWRQVMSGAANAAEFATRLTRKGTALMSDGTPIPSNTKLVFYLQRNDVILQAQSWSAGRFVLSMPDLSGSDEVLVFAEHNDTEIHVAAIRWDELPIAIPLPPSSHEGDDTDEYGIFAATTKMIDKSFGFYGSRPPGPSIVPISALEERIDGADVSISVQKYVTFGTMADLIKEVIPGLSARMSRDRTSVKVSLPEPMPVALSDPLYIIDGTVTQSTSYFLSLKPADLGMVRLVTSPAKLLPLGLIGKNGIVIVETLRGNAHPPASAWQVIEGIQPPLVFRAAPHPDRPDFRSTVFWAPTVQTDADGKALVEFYWSDDVGPVRVCVTGMTKDGRFFSGEEEFEVMLEMD
jgi:hypothetical protein